MTHQYSRAERLLTRPFPLSPPPDSPFVLRGKSKANRSESFAASSAVPFTNGNHKSSRKGKGKEPASVNPTLHGPSQMNLHVTMPFPDIHQGQFGGVINDIGFSEFSPDVSRLVDMSIACRYLAAQCQVCLYGQCYSSFCLNVF